MNLREIKLLHTRLWQLMVLLSGWVFAEKHLLMKRNGLGIFVGAGNTVAFKLADPDNFIARLYRPLKPLTFLSQFAVFQLEDLVNMP